MSNPMAVTLEQYTAGVTNFQQHYFLSGCSTEFTGQSIQISWESLASVVNNFINAHSVDANTVALRFVYCYNATTSAMYLRMQILTMTAATGQPGTYNLNDTTCAWFEITNGNIAITTDTDLSDTAYLSNFYYCSTGSCTSTSVQNLAANATAYAQNITFPWEAEILQMYIDNGSPSGTSIGFTACAFNDATANVVYPHNLAIYLADGQGNKMIDNNACSDFKNKAADCGTLCPFYCNVYITPSA